MKKKLRLSKKLKLSKLRNINRAMKYTKISLLLKLVLVKNYCIQKSDWLLIKKGLAKG